ncbi:MAG: L-seryl-tRNA(Sec) selenium transferase [Candidatus Korobacteraceae bacterium]
MESASQSELFRLLPSVDELLRSQAISPLISAHGHAAVVEACRAALDELRRSIAEGPAARTPANAKPAFAGDPTEVAANRDRVESAIAMLPAAVSAQLADSSRLSLRRVVNATGVVLHTNLGRAPLAESALQHALEVARGYSNLEFDLAAGERGERDAHVDRLFRLLFSDIEAQVSGQPSPQRTQSQFRTIVVNNNAAAVLLALNTLAEGGEVIVSRGELVEIGGSFRIPEVMAKSGAILREVGTTNRTRLADYEQAISERTKLLLRVHRSNFKIIGFTEQPPLEALVELGRRRQIPVVEDLGSGALVSAETMGGVAEPTVSARLRAGVDVVTFSGDKLLGGPQAGILAGRAELIARIRSNPLFRALRVDKLIYSVLESTLLAYVRQQFEAVPALRMLQLTAGELLARAQALAAQLAASCRGRAQVEVVACESVVGGGAAPGWELPSHGLAVVISGMGADELLIRLRGHEPPVIARVEHGRVMLDMRTVLPGEESEIVAALKSALGEI